jgi:MFS family permease
MFSTSYKPYALLLMTTVYTVSLLDRGLMFILLEPIKVDLRLSDAQIGFVTGIAFAAFYATLGVPIARWADSGRRTTIVTLAMAVWSLTAMACLFVTNYVQLVIARIVAAVGDSGVKPPIYSLLGDYFPDPTERTRAMYINELAAPIAGFASFVAAGWLNEVYDWRVALFVAGIPGLLLALLARLTLAEPPRRQVDTTQVPAHVTPLRDVLANMWGQPSCRHLIIAMVVLFTMGQGVVTWQAAFLIRNHSMGTAELGLWMGLIHTLGSATGITAGAYVLGRWYVGNERGQMRLAAFAASVSVPFYVAFLLLPNKYLALSVLIPQAIVFSAFIPAIYVLLQRLVPDNLRATSLMVLLFFCNLIGMGIGPQAVGILSDFFEPIVGAAALRNAMLLFSFLGFWAGYHLWRVGNTIHRDIEHVTVESAPAIASDSSMTGSYAK